ncbi:hypothetical protein TIFTF001_036577 [Ficus carica]|uniref:Uncharacterized protein n=1 Tax=Ficus carica TaxID=3494 RepID=A0AA88E4N1_FICCA|nr:hypothetical protein TIFTF001_036577 [Ficus carica]
MSDFESKFGPSSKELGSGLKLTLDQNSGPRSCWGLGLRSVSNPRELRKCWFLPSSLTRVADNKALEGLLDDMDYYNTRAAAWSMHSRPCVSRRHQDGVSQRITPSII